MIPATSFLFENLRLGLKNLYLHRLRTFLTALGIIFGVMAVIVMVAIGEGTKRDALRQMQQLGAQNVLIRSKRPPEGAGPQSNSRILRYGLVETDLQRVSNVPGLSRIVPLRDSRKRVSYGTKQFPAVNGISTTSDLFPVINLRLSSGRFFTKTDEQQAATVCVIGSEAARQMFPSQDPLGAQIQVGVPSSGMAVLTVVGVLEPTGLRANADKANIMVRDIDFDVYFPMSLSQTVFRNTIFRRTAGSMEMEMLEYSEIWVQVQSVDDVEQTAAIFSNIVGLPGREDVTVKAPIELLRAAEKTAKQFNFVLGGIASLSLLVGGIGIMNIMLASVTERTREIGIRRALGAKQRHITLQFLIETTVISQLGGLIGIAIGISAALVLPPLLERLGFGDYPTAIAPWSVIGSFVISGLTGICFGLYPAMAAAKMNPIEALRHE
ncbi:MAG TPA: ABC transporter permease [Tepidisphaeraceae bacterium]